MSESIRNILWESVIGKNIALGLVHEGVKSDAGYYLTYGKRNPDSPFGGFITYAKENGQGKYIAICWNEEFEINPNDIQRIDLEKRLILFKEESER